MAQEQRIVAGAAARYATALFELARDADATSGGALDTVAKDLDTLQSLLDQSEDLRRLVRSPVFSRDQQSAGINAVITKAELGTLTKNFIGLVARNRRLFAIEDMIIAYRSLLAKHRGELTASVVSAVPLNDDHVATLKAVLKESLGREVKLNTQVDSGLIGGLIVKVGSRMIDSSLRTKLSNLKIAMKEVG